VISGVLLAFICMGAIFQYLDAKEALANPVQINAVVKDKAMDTLSGKKGKETVTYRILFEYLDKSGEKKSIKIGVKSPQEYETYKVGQNEILIQSGRDPSNLLRRVDLEEDASIGSIAFAIGSSVLVIWLFMYLFLYKLIKRFGCGRKAKAASV
jgi:hypothetical protein